MHGNGNRRTAVLEFKRPLHVSPLLSNPTPGPFYHAHRLRLEKSAGSSNGFFKAAVSEVKRPLRNRFRIKTVTNL
jgi:hypothetical protein